MSDESEGNAGGGIPSRAPGDMAAEEFRRHGHAVIDWIAEFLRDPSVYPVLPPVAPGAVRAALPASPPLEPEPMDAVLADFERIIVPASAQWNHPAFFAYFAISGSAPGVLAESLAAALNVNAMLWRSAPAATELEQLTLDWLRQMLGLPAEFVGTITDTASSSTLYALAAAREMAGDLRLREDGLAGRPDVPRLRVYCSEEAHSSVTRAVMTLGLGISGVRTIATDAAFAMDVSALERAIADDRAAGVRPLAVVATVGTTSSAAIDPVGRIADVCAREKLWLHVDAAYGGGAAILSEKRWVLAGCDRADSLVMNPHKWLFVPLDCSALYTRRPELLKRAFSLVPEYLTVPQAGVGESEVVNLMDYGVALGRRFRALKLWMVMRTFGTEGLEARVRYHCELAREFAGWVDADPEWEVVAPVEFSLVCFRHAPAGVSEEERDVLNRRILDEVNASGEAFLSHTKLRGRFVLRLAVGNIRTEQRHVARVWAALRAAAEGERRAQS